MGPFKSEMRKIVTTTTVYWLLAGAVAFSLMAVSSLSGADEAQLARPIGEQLFMFLGTFVKLAFLILGIRVITDEFRFGTATPTFLFTPARGKVLVAKIGAAVASGAVLALIAQAVLFGSAAVLYGLKGETLQIGVAGAYAFAGGIVAGILWTVVGVGIGAIVRNQVIAIVGTVVWFMGLEDVIGSRMGDLDRFLPGRAGISLALSPDARALLLSLAIVAAFACAALALGAITLERKDVA